MTDSDDFDIAIVGAGPAGLSFAVAVARAGMRVALVEQQDRAVLAEPPCDGREIALTHRSVRTLRELGLWARIPVSEVAPLQVAQIMNSASPNALRLDARDAGLEALGVLVSNHLIRRAAWEAASQQPEITVLDRCEPAGVEPRAERVVLRLRDGRGLRARLLIAADSRHSQLRRYAGIPADLHDFGKTMLVCRMTHTQGLAQTAWEWFGDHQTVAVLPVRSPEPGHCSSIVVTLPPNEVRTLMEMEPAGFNAAIAGRLAGRLGQMSLQGERHAYPMVATWAHRFVAPRMALLGDAAVGMHPVTAHGFNLGLRGVDTLAHAVIAAARIGRDIGAAALLARFERQHRRDTRPLFLATNAIVRLYTDERPLARFGRQLALGAANRAPPFRRLMLSLLTERRELLLPRR